jgi:hypothetical protein
MCILREMHSMASRGKKKRRMIGQTVKEGSEYLVRKRGESPSPLDLPRTGNSPAESYLHSRQTI